MSERERKMPDSKRGLRIRIAQGLACLLLMFVLPLAAQENFGSVSGTVGDASGGVVPEAKISISSPNVLYERIWRPRLRLCKEKSGVSKRP